VSGLAVGSALVLFDGDLASPDLSTLWRLAEETATTVFGVSAPFLLACRKAGLEPAGPPTCPGSGAWDRPAPHCRRKGSGGSTTR